MTSLWDANVSIRAIFCTLAGLSKDDHVSLEAVEEKTRLQIESYIDSLGDFIPPFSSFLVEDLLEWKDGRNLSAKEMLTAIVEAESHR